MKKLLLLMLIVVAATACKKEKIAGDYYDLGYAFCVENANGEDMFNQATENNWSTNNVKYFYYKGDQKQTFYNPMLDYPNGFYVSKVEGRRSIVLDFFASGTALPTDNPQYISITNEIQWCDGSVDTINCKIYHPRVGYMAIREMAINGTVVWSYLSENHTPRVLLKTISEKGATVTLPK